ncbi:hypothetical protein Dimus_011181 [Dionaea muscipula]
MTRERNNYPRKTGDWIPVLHRRHQSDSTWNRNRARSGGLFTLFVEDIPDSLEELKVKIADFGRNQDRKSAGSGRREGGSAGRGLLNRSLNGNQIRMGGQDRIPYVKTVNQLSNGIPIQTLIERTGFLEAGDLCRGGKKGQHSGKGPTDR